MSRFDRSRPWSYPAAALVRAAAATRSIAGRIALLGLLALLAGPVAAEPPTASIVDPTPRVAGAIDAASGIEAAATGPRLAQPASSRLLTRATVRARIAAIDPKDWLSQYGQTEHRRTTHR